MRYWTWSPHWQNCARDVQGENAVNAFGSCLSKLSQYVICFTKWGVLLIIHSSCSANTALYHATPQLRKIAKKTYYEDVFFSFIYHIILYLSHRESCSQSRHNVPNCKFIYRKSTQMNYWRSCNHSEAPHTYTISQFGCVGFKTVHLKVSIGSALIIEKKRCFRFRKQIFRTDLCMCYSISQVFPVSSGMES